MIDICMTSRTAQTESTLNLALMIILLEIVSIYSVKSHVKVIVPEAVILVTVTGQTEQLQTLCGIINPSMQVA